MEKKYKLTDEYITIGDKKLYRIEALKDFADVKKGDKGGFVESEYNLSQDSNCWIYDDAKVYDNAAIHGNASVRGNAEIYGNALISGYASIEDNVKIYDNAEIFGHACIYDYAKIFNNAIVYDHVEIYDNVEIYGNTEIYGYITLLKDTKISSNSDYIVFKNWWSSDRYFTWTRSNNMWSVGCFYGTGEELITKAYKDSTLSGQEYERVVRYVESILKNNKIFEFYSY